MNNDKNINKDTKELEKTRALTTIIFAYGCRQDHPNVNMGYFFDNLPSELPKVEIGSSITANLLLVKIPSYGVKITPPDWLIYMIDVCGGGNPGFVQLIYKELLQFINNSKYKGTGIPDNYVITAKDFSNCFPYDYPILIDPKQYLKYSELWDKQKRDTNNILEPDNKVDTAEYWLEVMESK